MTDREKQIAEAAVRVFTRYGIKRVTMADIAEEAGIARQTLYNVFANKDEVIHATVLFYMEGQRARTEAAWTEQNSLSDKLDAVFEFNVFEPWDHITALPDASDIAQADHSAGKAATAIAGAAMRESLERLFAPHEASLGRNGHSPRSMAAFVQSTMLSLKHEINNRAELERLIGTLKAMVLQSAFRPLDKY
ncbi:TetR/AcrR family transcriptional regulator [Gymnodinialimonas ulvae]|uniref:TetR/AcrR family transcriptional regulator n=1 Tax=Gymnodinialimonas ulvae TaxID=3126504 RepID=UPI00309D8778